VDTSGVHREEVEPGRRAERLHGGLGPELLGVAEVEGDHVFEELIAETGNTHLKVVKDPSGTSDLRGIDVSLA
jgi:hypothetical protein